MMSARNKRNPKYDDYLSFEELVGLINAYGSILSGNSYNYRAFATGVHLVLEVSLKKIAIHHNLRVSTTSHNTGTLIFDLIEYEPFAKGLMGSLVSSGNFRLLQGFPYDELRFNHIVSKDCIEPMLLLEITRAVLRRLEHIERSRN